MIDLLQFTEDVLEASTLEQDEPLQGGTGFRPLPLLGASRFELAKLAILVALCKQLIRLIAVLEDR